MTCLTLRNRAMLPIQHSCQPRQDILQGSFNPEIFTASLSQVVDHYRGKPAVTHALYTNAKQFFRDATYATEGLRMVLTDVFSRLAGEPVPQHCTAWRRHSVGARRIPYCPDPSGLPRPRAGGGDAGHHRSAAAPYTG